MKVVFCFLDKLIDIIETNLVVGLVIASRCVFVCSEMLNLLTAIFDFR